MIQIYVNEGLVDLLKRIVTPSVRYHLFTNVGFIVRETVLADLVEETTFGYASVLVPLASFSLSAVVANIGILSAPPISFTPAGGDWDLAGFYVTDSASTTLYWAANFDGFPITQPDGVPLVITPKLGDFNNPLV